MNPLSTPSVILALANQIRTTYCEGRPAFLNSSEAQGRGVAGQWAESPTRRQLLGSLRQLDLPAGMAERIADGLVLADEFRSVLAGEVWALVLAGEVWALEGDGAWQDQHNYYRASRALVFYVKGHERARIAREITCSRSGLQHQVFWSCAGEYGYTLTLGDAAVNVRSFIGKPPEVLIAELGAWQPRLSAEMCTWQIDATLAHSAWSVI